MTAGSRSISGGPRLSPGAFAAANADERRRFWIFCSGRRPPRRRLARNEKPPVPAELPAGMDPARAAAFVDFCHTLLNSNEFLYVN